MINICTKYGFDSLIISGSYGGHRRHTTDDGRRTTDDGRRTTPGVWHKLPTGELKNILGLVSSDNYAIKFVFFFKSTVTDLLQISLPFLLKEEKMA